MIELIDENDFFIVLYKPHGVSCHNATPSLFEYLSDLKKPTHFVSRLDTDTSGLVIVAQKPEYQSLLTEALTEGEKAYRALGRGPFKNQHQLNEAFKIDLPISDKAEGRRNPAGNKSDQKPSLTIVTALRTNSYFTEFRCAIKTGRQHQIRKHLALIGHPIVNDSRYNDPKYNLKISQLYQLNRLELHAETLNFKINEKTYSYSKPYSLDHYFQK